MLDKILTKIGKFSYRFRYFVLVFAILLFIGACIGQSFSGVSYSYSDYNKVTEIFPEKDTLVVVYDNEDENKINDVISFLSQNEHVTGINAYANTLGVQMNYSQMSSVAGMDESFIKTLYYRYENDVSSDTMTLVQAVNFIPNVLTAFGMEDSEYATMISSYQGMINGIANNHTYDAQSMAAMLSMEATMVGYIYQSIGQTEMTLESFVNTLLMSGSLDETATQQMNSLKQIIDNVKSNTLLTATELIQVFQVEGFTSDLASVLYSFYYAKTADLSNKYVSIYDFMTYISNMANGSLSSMLSAEQKATLTASVAQIQEGKAQLVGENNSRMILTLDYELESEEMYDFYEKFETKLNDTFDKDYYFVGNSAMSNELSKTFPSEYLMISIITAIAIFLVVCITFKKLSIPLLLVCIIECAVFITMSAMAIANVSMYFIALIIVQCILMGSMVDYGILFTNYYTEVRKEYTVDEALPETLKRSIRAIAMSAIILIVITFICGLIMEGAVASILMTVCIGAISALLLVVFVLPSLLAIFDKMILKKKKG